MWTQKNSPVILSRIVINTLQYINWKNIFLYKKHLLYSKDNAYIKWSNKLHKSIEVWKSPYQDTRISNYIPRAPHLAPKQGRDHYTYSWWAECTIYQGKNELCCISDQTDKLQSSNGKDNALYPAIYNKNMIDHDKQANIIEMKYNTVIANWKFQIDRLKEKACLFSSKIGHLLSNSLQRLLCILVISKRFWLWGQRIWCRPINILQKEVIT